MNAFRLKTHSILERYGNFCDGAIISCECVFRSNLRTSAKIVFPAKNKENQQWKKIAITMDEVEEMYMKVRSDLLNTILLSVRILEYDDLICIDVDGNYSSTGGPVTLTEVREDGDYYLIGKRVSAEELRGE
ncbi:hypothetical protein [Massilia aquatica]|uniref:Phage protein n=1 Tax=Massilia aquatica TaxID=2609000 RepID=A0ABX0MDB1_9BURK|nr:hypothetical protein [Massilia aquatica]NHZ42955.1 hypothetical protein [Massilia aquatica]